MAQDGGFRVLFDRSPLPMWVLDRKTLRFLDVNEAAAAKYGYSREEFLNMTAADICPAADAPRLRAIAAEPGRGPRQAGEWRHYRRDGEVIDVRMTSNTLRFAGRDAMLVVAEDIAGQKPAEEMQRAAEEALRASEARYRSLFEQVPVGLYRMTPAGRLLEINDAFVRMLGYPSRDLLLDTNASNIYVDPEVRRQWSEQIERDGAVASSEARVRRYDGSLIWVREHARVVRDTAGDVCYEGAISDVTHRRQTAAHLEALNDIVLAAAGAADLRTFLETLIDRMLRVLEGDRGGVWLGSGPDAHVTRNITPERSAQVVTEATRLGLDFTRVLAVDDWEAMTGPMADALKAVLRRAQAGRASLTGPLLMDDRVIGGFAIGTSRPRRWSPAEVRLAESIGKQVGSVAERLRLLDEVRTLYDETARRSAQLQALREIDRAITGSVDLGVSLNVVLAKVMTQLSVDAACILMLNPHTQILEYFADHGFHTIALRHVRLKLGEGLAGRAALDRRGLGVSDLDTARDALVISRLPQGRTEGFKATYAVPLIAKGQLLGVLQVFFRRPASFDEEWLEFLNTLAGQTAIAISDARQFEALQRSNVDLATAYDTTLTGWAHALELRTRETDGHTQRVMELTVRLANRLGVSEDELVHIRRGALLHDIGKMAVPDSVLFKRGPLTDEERETMERHPVRALELLMPIAYLRPAVDIPYCHHEKWDGTGYPRSLKGEQIPLAARIFSVAHVWDVLRLPRTYRPAQSDEVARAHLRDRAGTQFDPAIVEAFLEMVSEDLSVDQASPSAVPR